MTPGGPRVILFIFVTLGNVSGNHHHKESIEWSKFESLKEHWSSVLSWRFCRHVKFFLYLRWTARLPWGQCNACQTKSNPCLQGWVYHNTRVTRHQLRWGIELRANDELRDNDVSKESSARSLAEKRVSCSADSKVGSLVTETAL